MRVRPRALGVPEIAWMLLIPCAAVALTAIVALGPALGRVLFAPGSDQLWPPGWWETAGRPEPVKQGRYVLAALGPVLFAGAIALVARRRLALRSSWVRPVVFASYATVLALVVVALARQGLMASEDEPMPPLVGTAALAAAAALVAAAVVLMRTERVASWAAALARETTARRWAALAAVVVVLAAWLLAAVQTDRTIGDSAGPNLAWTFNDALAVLEGRTPLVDFHLIYAKLLPYPAASVLAIFGTTTFVYTTFMALLTGLVLLAVYGVFRLVTRSSLLALVLLVPFVATSDVPPGTNLDGRLGSPMTMPAVWPMRYGGVYLLAWVTARHIAADPLIARL